MTDKNLTPQVPGDAPVEQVEAAPEAKTKGKTAKAIPSGGLPEASSIDAKQITRAVLTKQGWVCPDKQAPKA